MSDSFNEMQLKFPITVNSILPQTDSRSTIFRDQEIKIRGRVDYLHMSI